MYNLEIQKFINLDIGIVYRSIMTSDNLKDIEKEMCRLILDDGVSPNTIRISRILSMTVDLNIQIIEDLERGSENESK